MNWPVRILFFAMSAVLVSSCGNPTTVVSDENLQTANNDAVLEILSDELDDMTSVVLNSYSESGAASGGRTEALTDDRLTCTGMSILYTNVALDNSSGTVTVTFPPDGCKDIKGNVRKGAIVIQWTGGKWYKVGSTHIINLSNYNINDIAVTGTRILTCTLFDFVSAKSLDVTWTLQASHSLTWPDGTNATFTMDKTRRWDHSSADDLYTHTDGPNGKFAVAGTNRHGKNFSVSITTPLIFNRACISLSKNFMPVSGTKILIDITRGKSLAINYGTGTCDNSYKLTIDGVSQTLHAKNNSSDD